MSAGHAHHHHGHQHGHHHHGPPPQGDRRWVIGVALNGAFVLIEATAGILGHSMALLADAGHNLSDVLALAMAGAAAWLARRPSDPRRTYGFGKATVLAALANAVILVVILFGSWEVLKEAFNLAIDTAPAAVDVAAVRAFLAEWPGVSAVHDLHVWPLSTTETALTAHLVRDGGGDDEFLKTVCRGLKARFHIGHATLQVEVESLEACEELHA